MNISFSFWVSIISFILCLFLVGFLCFNPYRKKSSYFLSIFIVDYSLIPLLLSGLNPSWAYYFPYPFFLFVFFLSPLLYFHANEVLDYEMKDFTSLFHFIPFLIFLIFTGFGLIRYGEHYWKSSLFYLCFLFLFIFQVVSYYVKTYLRIKESEEINPKIDKVSLRWLKHFITAHIIWSIIFILSFSILFFYPYMTAVSSIFSIFTFANLLAFAGCTHIYPEVFFEFRKANILPVQEGEGKEDEFLITLLDFFAFAKPYLDPNLSAESLARMLNVSVYFLTNVINKYLDKNFYDFVSSYRVEEAKIKLDELINKKEVFDFLSLYSELGFHSKAEFSKVFKTYTGMTPSQYKTRMLTLKNRDIYFTVGVFIDSFYDNYEINIISGIEQFAINNGIRVIYFNGGAINSPQYAGTRRNSVYDIAKSDLIDGIIMISSSLSSYITNEEFENFCKNYSDKFIVSIGKEINDAANILVDNRSGMKELLTHLIEIHNYKKIAFIKGPENNTEAIERFEVYKDVLDKYNIPFDENLVVKGLFLGDTAKNALNTLLDERNVDFDVIVAPNDTIAIQIIQELAFRGIRVPEDKAVVGFDDIKDSIQFFKPLTTVHQPLFEIGYKAMKTLFEAMYGQKASSKFILPTKLVIRESCGCKGSFNSEEKIVKVIGKYTSFETLNRLRELLITDISELLYEQFSNIIDNKLLFEWAEDIIDSLIEDIKDLREGRFLITLEEILSEAITNRVDAYFWNFIIIRIFNSVISNLSSSRRIDFTNHLKKKSKYILDKVREKIMDYPIMETKRKFDFFMVTQSLTTCFDLNILSDTISKHFSKMGIKSCYICLFENNTNNEITKYSRVLIAYENKEKIEYNENEAIFRTFEIVPGGPRKLSNESQYVIGVLSFYNELLGFVLYELEFRENKEIFEFLTLQLSNTIKGVIEYEKPKRFDFKKNIYEKKPSPTFSNKYQKSRLPDYIAKRYYTKLIDCLNNQKLYKNMDLSLQDLAEELGIPRNHLSYVINEYAKTNFYDLVNTYRVEEAKRLLINTSKETLNILDIAFESGFNSKSTFNYVFKKYTGKTPSEYREENIKKCR